ncbi:MAG: beta-L-arabinofuranosidase domain-containing protein [Lachnospiraceae bacterium]
MMLHKIKTGNVHLLPGIFKERAELNRKYLMELEKQCLLQNFYLEAGIVMPGLQVVDDPAAALLHWGWEAPICQLRGHFLGHWMSAAAVLSATDDDRELKAKLDCIVNELAKCQQQNGGKWIGSIPEKYFDKLADNEYVWSPQYTMHKTLMGLTHAYQYAGNQTALQILDGLSDWYTEWTDAMLQKNPHAIYSGEEGGMLEIWATLYEITGLEKYLALAEKYSHPSLFKKLQNNADPLSNCHANASIPWAHGAAKMYEITNDEKWLTLVQLFWKCAVTDRGEYCSGGQGAGEFWVPPHMQGRFLCERNQEFCTVYNMVRLADYLYRFTQDTVYADYIERNLYNGFLAQQNKETGMPTYFLPLSAGSKKKWGSRTKDFWCCHGTMVQAQTLYPSLCYYENAEQDRLIISQYIPSSVQWERKQDRVELTQCVDMKYYNDQAFFDGDDESQMSRWLLKFHIRANSRFTLSFRIPDWLKQMPVMYLNKERLENVPIENGYINLCRHWKEDEISLYLPASLEFKTLPDQPQMAAVTEGPIVLAGLCDRDCGLYGADGDALSILEQSCEHTYSAFPWKQSTYHTRMQPENMTFIPLYEITDERYTVYFTQKELN